MLSNETGSGDLQARPAIGSPGLDAARVVHADDWLIVVDKPAGLLSVRGRGPRGEDCLHARVRARWQDALVVHRLDMATSGLMLFARGPESQRRLSRAFEQRAVAKRYCAVVVGRLEPDGVWSEIDLPLAPDWPNRPRQKVDFAGGRASRTLWRALGPAQGPWGEGTRLELAPLTGRSHQLRVHLAAIGHPIAGDTLYASKTEADASPRLLLHAARLALQHPSDGREVGWRCAAPFLSMS